MSRSVMLIAIAVSSMCVGFAQTSAIAQAPPAEVDAPEEAPAQPADSAAEEAAPDAPKPAQEQEGPVIVPPRPLAVPKAVYPEATTSTASRRCTATSGSLHHS